MNDGPFLDLFFEMLRSERGAAANTLDAYRRDLAEFQRSIDHHRPDLRSNIALADDVDIRAFLADLLDSGQSARSAARKLSALKQYFLFLQQDGLRKHNPARHIDGPKTGKPLPKLVSEDQVGKLLTQAQQDAESGTPTTLRTLALVEMLYATGMRASELVSLPVAVAARDARFLVVRGKGNKERMIPVGEPAQQAMTRYLEQGRVGFLPLGKESVFLFPESTKTGHLSRQKLGTTLKVLAGKAGVDPGNPVSTRAASRVCKPLTRPWRRPARGSNAAGTCRYFNHTDLYPYPRRTAEGHCGRSSPLESGFVKRQQWASTTYLTSNKRRETSRMSAAVALEFEKASQEPGSEDR